MSDKRWYTADALEADLTNHNHHLRATSEEEIERRMRKRYPGAVATLCSSRSRCARAFPVLSGRSSKAPSAQGYGQGSGREGFERSAIRSYMSIDAQVAADFTRARRRSFMRRMGARLRGDLSSLSPLLSFEEVSKALGLPNKVRLGLRVVPVERIVGSLGRHREFDRSFLPNKASLEENWRRIDRAFHRGEDLPPVALYKVGGAYFVEDGNHPVSVAR
jgi:hypothetical protein